MMSLRWFCLVVAATWLLGGWACSAAPAEASRALAPETVAWWTFDNHFRDEVRGLELAVTPNERKDLEEFYASMQFVDDVPLLQVDGRANWRGYYRWGVPNLARGEMGAELDLAGPFTIEGYLNPLPPGGRPPQHRTYILRKNRLGDGGAERQWWIGLHRDDESDRYAADLWAIVAFQTPDGRSTVKELSARDALKFNTWHNFAVRFDGAELSLWVNREQVAATNDIEAGSRLLPSPGRGELLISAMADESPFDKPPEPAEARNWRTVFRGRIDELRIARVALPAERMLALPHGIEDAALPDPPQRTEYASLAQRHLDFLIRHGTDKYGPVHSPLIGSTLDPKAKRMLKLKPPRVPGMPFVGDAYRSPMLGCDLTLMRNTLMAMRALSAVTGEARFAGHADSALKFWLGACIYPSGVWPVGEHGVWNFYTDKPEPKRPHEPQALLDWPRYWNLAPEVVRKELELMHRIHTFEYSYKGKTLAFHGRHGSSGGSAHSAGGCGFGRQSGLFARGWAFLYSQTKDEAHLKWVKDQLELMWELRDPKTDLCPGQTFPPPGSTFAGRTYSERRGATTQTLWAAIGFLDAVQWLDDAGDRKLLLDRALALAMANFNSYYQWDGKKFTDTRARWKSSTHSPDGSWLLLKVWERAGKPESLLAQARLVADDRMANWRPTKATDAGCYGWNIMFYVQIHNETGAPKYLDFARRLGDWAAHNLVTPEGLVVGSRHYRYYDRMYHIPKLVQGFLALDHPSHPAIEPLLREPYF